MDLTPADLQTYADDGVVVLRGLLPPDRVAHLQAAVDRVIAAPTAIGSTTGAFSHDMFLWRHDPDFREVATRSPLPAAARALMGSAGLRLFFDQLLVKEPGLRSSIAWHQDLQTFPVTGEQVVSMWLALDPVDPDNGAVSYARGSHRWGQLFRDGNYPEDTGHPEVPDPATFDVLQWSLAPGDVVAHHPLTLHGSRGNRSTVRRRGLSVRYAGDDVRFDPKEPNFMTRVGLTLPDLPAGAPLEHELFPVLT